MLWSALNQLVLWGFVLLIAQLVDGSGTLVILVSFDAMKFSASAYAGDPGVLKLLLLCAEDTVQCRS